MTLYKARRIGGQEVPDLHIDITVPWPDDPYNKTESYEEFIRRNQAEHRHVAEEIAARLQATLAGGTWDALVVEILQRSASVLKVNRGVSE